MVTGHTTNAQLMCGRAELCSLVTRLVQLAVGVEDLLLHHRKHVGLHCVEHTLTIRPHCSK